MPAAEFESWRRFYDLHPFGEWREDLRMGILACQVVGPYLKRGQRVTPSTFMPKFIPDNPKTPSDLGDFFKAMTQRMGGTIQ